MMNRNPAGRCALVVLALVFAAPSGAQPATVQTAGGMRTVAFERPQGRIIVHLPDNIRAGDTISGTVIADPAGSTADERARNSDVLEGYVVEMDGRPVGAPAADSAGPGALVVIRALTDAGRLVRTFRGQFDALPEVIQIKTLEGEVVERASLDDAWAAFEPASEFRLPTLAQQGRPIRISGSFDGDASNTSLHVSAAAEGQEATVPVEPPRSILLAESRGQATFESTRDVTGPALAVLSEGGVEMAGTFQNVGVRLTAPQTSLLSGQQTPLTVEVVGLGGAPADLFPVDLTVENLTPGVVSLPGGAVETRQITASETAPGTPFVLTRTLTGVVPGAFVVSATVSGQQLGQPMQFRPAGNGPWPAPEAWDARTPTSPDAPVDMNDATFEQLMHVPKIRLDITRCDLIYRRSLVPTYEEQLWFDAKIALVEAVITELGMTPADCFTIKP